MRWARVETCGLCRRGEHADHHQGVWARADGGDPVVCLCETCYPGRGFVLVPEVASARDRARAIAHREEWLAADRASCLGVGVPPWVRCETCGEKGCAWSLDSRGVELRGTSYGRPPMFLGDPAGEPARGHGVVRWTWAELRRLELDVAPADRPGAQLTLEVE